MRHPVDHELTVPGYGSRVTMTIGMILLSFGQILSSFTTQIWQLFLTQGVMCVRRRAGQLTPAGLVSGSGS